MKTPFFTLVLLFLFIIFSTSSIAKTWENYISVSTTGHSHAHGYLAEMKSAFKERLADWETSTEKDVNDYVKQGIGRKSAELAVKARIRWAKTVVDEKFLGNKRIPDIVASVENRVYLLKNISTLGYERLQALSEKYDLGLTKDFNNCLCNYYSTSGNSIRFSPPPDKWCDNGDPCKGGNFGCVSHDFPDVPSHYALCARQYHTDKGLNICQAIGSNVIVGGEPNTSMDRIAEVLINRNQAYKNSCLPSLPGKIASNTIDSQNFFKHRNLDKARQIIENSSNICEESVAVNLFLMSMQSKGMAEVTGEALATWIMPDDLFVASALNDKFLSGLLKGVAGKTISAVSITKNIYQNVKLYDQESKSHYTDPAFKEAYELFQKSKTWTDKQISVWEKESQQKLTELPEKLKQIEIDYQKQLVTNYQKGMSRQSVESDGQKTWQDRLDERQKELRKEQAETKKYAALYEHFKLLQKRKMMIDFRKPFNKYGCKKFLADREKSCKEKLAVEALQLKKQKEIELQRRKKALQQARQDELDNAARTREKLSKAQNNKLSVEVGGFVPGTEPKK